MLLRSTCGRISRYKHHMVLSWLQVVSRCLKKLQEGVSSLLLVAIAITFISGFVQHFPATEIKLSSRRFRVCV